MVQETSGISNSGLKENPALDVTSLSKTKIYEALYAVNAGIQQCLNALTVLEASGLPMGCLSANEVVLEEIRAGINHRILTVMEQIEAHDWAAHEKSRICNALERPLAGPLSPCSPNCQDVPPGSR